MLATNTVTPGSPAHLMACIRAAKSAGLAPDQVRLFLNAGYVPLKSMLAFHAACREADGPDGPDQILLAGTRGPGKSHAALAQVVLDDCQRFPGLKVLFLRLIQKAAGESLEDLVRKVCRNIDHKFNRSAGRLDLGNGSRVLIGGYKDAGDIDKYLGIEYDLIVLEEGTQLTEDKVDKIRGSLRSSRSDWFERMYITTNADGVGVGWCKKRFVIPWREGRLAAERRRYVEAYYKDNPYLKRSYVRYLEGLTGALSRAWAHLDWDAFEGMAFPMWDYSKHVCSPFELPAAWLRWRSFDWGTADPFVCLWWALDPDTRRQYVYRELYQTGLTDRQQAQRVLDLTPPGENVSMNYADPGSYWQNKATPDGEWFTPASVYAAAGVPLTRADNARIPGKRKIDQALGLLPDGRPGLVVFSTCVHLIEQLSTLVYDRVHVEDIDDSVPDHAYDALRYGLTNYNPMARLQDERKDKRRRDRGGLSDLRSVF